ncbi:MAG: tetratricopeptide repeat protein [Pirellulaceae bacterium]
MIFPNEPFCVIAKAGKRLNRLLHEDRSFSGHERNCAFLNLPSTAADQRFADISAVSGLDMADDGRAIAVCDWDFDGDLDLWITNRTAPRIRLMRNNSQRQNNFVAFKLQGDGQRTNRDAVGARIELVLETSDGTRLVKSVSAGEGFLSQSSNWLHFGLGRAQRIQKIIVDWPNAERREYDGLQANQRYIVDQKSQQVAAWSPPAHREPLKASSPQTVESNGMARTILPAKRLLPTLRSDDFEESINTKVTGPTVISIWSATCVSCVKELSEFTSHADQLRAAGLNVIAINLDNLEGDAQQAQQILQRIDFPFLAVSGSMELVRSLDVLKRAILDRWQTLSVPTSLLVDEHGFVTAIYQGPVEIKQLLADLQLQKLPETRLREFSSPFSGKWIMPPPTADPLQVVSRFIDEAMIQSGIDYLERHAELADQTLPGSSQEPGDLFHVLAVLLRDQQQTDESMLAFQKAIEYRPNDFRFRTDFASLLAEVGKLEEAAEQLQQGVRINSQDISVQRKLAFVRMAQGNFAAAIVPFQTVLEKQPNDVASWYNLANALRSNGQLMAALDAYRQTLKVQPNMTLAANNLAWILATHPDDTLRNGSEAVQWAEHVCQQTEFAEPSFLDTLACAYAEANDFEQAVSTAKQAMEVMRERDVQAVSRIRGRMEQFEQQQPFRDPSLPANRQ